MKITKVICDLDGVILDYVRAYIEWTHPRYKPYKIDEMVAKVVKWDGLLEVTGTTFDDLKYIQNDLTFISTVKKYPHADQLINGLIEKFGKDNICFLTAVTHHQREIQIESWYPDIPLFCGHKKEFWVQPNYLLIDDSPTNCQKWYDAGGKIHLFKQTWNADSPLHSVSINI